MNLLLLRDEDFQPDGTVRLVGRRLLHAREVLRAAEGDVLRVGRLGGLTGLGTTFKVSDEELLLRVELSDPPPPRPGIELLLAMPRPKALKKVLPAVASLGVDRVVLVNAARVEKSYFSSKVIDEAFELFCEGLEQARDTRPPELLVRERFRPFVEDELSDVFPATRLLAHPIAPEGVPKREGRAVVAIGPEGGWVPFELDLLRKQGFVPFSLGPRPLRVEVAVSYLLGALR
ncbi:MAG TPA: 16S rRNA (uracil(1498)-N(3))-methyltransferase [Myxococcales bacterium]|jgi:RsmE family RNA methyltransferase|nr:16S rRNA (uracil(1498)-N(3))-methyltransferase [Myxococcales bacterium]